MGRDDNRLHSTPNWIIVANESAAEFYSRNGSTWTAQTGMRLDNQSARAKIEDLISDRAGRSLDSHGQGRHAMSKQLDKKETAALRFAETIAESILQISRQKPTPTFAIIAAPRMLGLLRKTLKNKHIDDEYVSVSKDVVGHDIRDIEKLLST